jgi:hypothetical protein
MLACSFYNFKLKVTFARLLSNIYIFNLINLSFKLNILETVRNVS